MKYVMATLSNVFIISAIGFLLKCNDINSITQYFGGAIAMLLVIQLNNKLFNVK